MENDDEIVRTYKLFIARAATQRGYAIHDVALINGDERHEYFCHGMSKEKLIGYLEGALVRKMHVEIFPFVPSERKLESIPLANLDDSELIEIMEEARVGKNARAERDIKIYSNSGKPIES
jgi:hypothetical protein